MNKYNKKLFYSWLAGFIDGEGCFYVRRRKGKGADFWILITQGIKGRDVFIDIQKILGFGKISKPRRDGVQHIFFMDKNNLRKLLPLLLPFFRVKKERANQFYRELILWMDKKINPTLRKNKYWLK